MQLIPCWQTLLVEHVYCHWLFWELCALWIAIYDNRIFLMQLIPCWRTVHLENIIQNLLLDELWASLLCACNIFIPIDSLTSSVPGTYLSSWAEEHVPAIKNAEFECIAATGIKLRLFEIFHAANSPPAPFSKAKNNSLQFLFINAKFCYQRMELRKGHYIFSLLQTCNNVEHYYFPHPSLFCHFHFLNTAWTN